MKIILTGPDVPCASIAVAPYPLARKYANKSDESLPVMNWTAMLPMAIFRSIDADESPHAKPGRKG